MRALVLLADRAERSPVVREVRAALQDGARWGWLVALVAGAAVWVARGMPDPATASGAGAAMLVGTAAAWWRSWRRAEADERGAVAWMVARRWLTVYGAAAAVVPAVVAAVDGAGLAALAPVGVALVVLVVLAVVTIPWRARARLLARLRVGARSVAGEEVQVGRALWSGPLSRHLERVFVTYPPEWGVHRDTKRDDLVERMVWDLCGPPPRTPVEAVKRPDYLTTFNGGHHRLEIERVPSLPRRLDARDWGDHDGIVIGQTIPDLADVVVDGVPLAVYRPENHLLMVGATQHGKSSGARAWAVYGLTHGVFPGGAWMVDGKGSGNFAPLIGRKGVHAVAHSPDEWRHVLVDLVAPEIARRYAKTLAWRSGQSSAQPRHRRALLILDEIQQVLAAAPDLAGTLDTLARQALEAGVYIWVLTQRPDAKDAVPGAVRDQLVDRVTFGPLSASGARMSFDIAGDDWHRALGVAPVVGRALTWMAGTWRPVQAPWLPFPVDDPDAEALYPPRTAQGAAQPVPQPRPAAQPAGPAPVPPPQPQPSAAAAPPVPQVQDILNDFGDADGTAGGAAGGAGESAAAAYDPADPYAHRRRRRD